MAFRRRGVVTVVVLAASAVVGVAVALSVRADPTEHVGPVSVDQVSVAPSMGTTEPGASPPSSAVSPTGSSRGTTQQVEALDPLQGTLEAKDDPGEFRLGNVELDFGPSAWVLTAPPMQDYGRDGRTERLEAELNGLVGRPVDLLVRLDDGDDAAVYMLNGLPYRDPAGAAPWTPPRPPAQPAPPADVRAAAADAVGPRAEVDDLESVQAGSVAWEASVTAANGTDFLVLLSATAKVLTVRED